MPSKKKKYLYPIATYSREHRKYLKSLLNIVRWEVYKKRGKETTIADALIFYIKTTLDYFIDNIDADSLGEEK